MNGCANGPINCVIILIKYFIVRIGFPSFSVINIFFNLNICYFIQALAQTAT